MPENKTALVAVESEIAQDPRVRRQIAWLINDGWKVDSLGLGPSTASNVREHFVLADIRRWKVSRWGTLLIYGFRRNRARFKTLTLSRVPGQLRDDVREGKYDLIVLNDRHFVPWVENPSEFTSATRRRTRVHLDLHEYFVPELRRNSLWRLATAGHYKWSRGLIGHAAFTSRSTVNTGIAALYAREFGFAVPAVIRNSPEYEELRPHPVDASEIKLIHHGAARGDRGLKEIIDALRLLDARFTATFMLIGSSDVINELRDYSADLGNRVKFAPPARTEDLARAVNEFDLEVMFYAPRTRNLELALPNKLFEAVQGRLGLVVGESPMMAEIVRTYDNGIVVSGWEARDLARALNSLTKPQIEGYKAASDSAARALSSDPERATFVSIVSRIDSQGGAHE